MSLTDIVNDMRTDIEGIELSDGHHLPVRISALQTKEQFLQEMKAISGENLPAVIIVLDGAEFNPKEITMETRLSLVVVDHFRARSNERALKLFDVVDALLTDFPALGKKRGLSFVYPTDIQLASVDPAFAAIAIGFMIKCRSL